MTNFFQGAVLGTALLTGLVGCSAEKVLYEPIRDGLILQNPNSGSTSCQDLLRYENQRPIFGESLDNFYMVGLVREKIPKIAQDNYIQLVFPTRAVDTITGEHLIAKPCLLQKEITKGNA